MVAFIRAIHFPQFFWKFRRISCPLFLHHIQFRPAFLVVLGLLLLPDLLPPFLIPIRRLKVYPSSLILSILSIRPIFGSGDCPTEDSVSFNLKIRTERPVYTSRKPQSPWSRPSEHLGTRRPFAGTRDHHRAFVMTAPHRLPIQ
jgi:hypothetical protein